MEKIRFLPIFFVFSGIFLLFSVFWPVIKQEVKYSFDRLAHIKYSVNVEEESSFEKPLVVPNTDFAIAIPKIGAVAPVIENVDPLNKTEYLQALKEGVAHARGTALPMDKGNVYIFAHSTDAFYNVGKYNAVFYLLEKLTVGDEIYIYYRGQKIKYLVQEVKVVSPDAIEYLTKDTEEKTLTLQTCYPPGTTFKRLVVIAKQEEI